MAEAALAQVRIVLVEPAGPLNVGSVARVMKNMGLWQLVLVKPGCDPLSEPARQMAVHGADVLEAASVVDSLPQALAGCQRAIATTARTRAAGEVLELPEAVLPWLLPSDPPADFQAALIFGPEDRGLSNGELNYAQRFLRIPSSDLYPALNLAQAVAVCCYLLRLAALGEAASPPVSPTLASDLSEAGAALDQIEGFYQQLEALLLQVGYLYPHTATSRMEKFRRLLHRAAPTQQELAMLRGILSQVDWALASKQRQQ
ncbi:MAG: RNA methyltransferase [Cyanobacteria bacterium Co-bin13]|nr:RNA methyltransferase [Cyanobacteria bacterium Co-bin13]